MVNKKEMKKTFVAFRVDTEVSNKLDVAANCRYNQKQEIFFEMIDLYFKKKPLTVSELNILKQRTK